MRLVHCSSVLLVVAACSPAAPERGDDGRTAQALAALGGAGSTPEGMGGAAPDDESAREKPDDPFAVGCLTVYPNETCTDKPASFAGDLCKRSEQPKQIITEYTTADCEAACCDDWSSKTYDCDAECKKTNATWIGKCVEVYPACTDGKEWTESAVCRCYPAEPKQDPGPVGTYCKCPFGGGAKMLWDNCKTCAAGDDCFQKDCAWTAADGAGTTLIFACIHNPDDGGPGGIGGTGGTGGF